MPFVVERPHRGHHLSPLCGAGIPRPTGVVEVVRKAHGVGFSGHEFVEKALFRAVQLVAQIPLVTGGVVAVVIVRPVVIHVEVAGRAVSAHHAVRRGPGERNRLLVRGLELARRRGASLQAVHVGAHDHPIGLVRNEVGVVGARVHPPGARGAPILAVLHLHEHEEAVGRHDAARAVHPIPRDAHVRDVVVHVGLQVRHLGAEQVQILLRLLACRVDGRGRRGQQHPEARAVKLGRGVQRGVQARGGAIVAPHLAGDGLALAVFGEEVVGQVRPASPLQLALPLHVHVAGVLARPLRVRGQVERSVDGRRVVGLELDRLRRVAAALHHRLVRHAHRRDGGGHVVGARHRELHAVRLAFALVAAGPVVIVEHARHAQRVGLPLLQMPVLKREGARVVDVLLARSRAVRRQDVVGAALDPR